MGDRDDKIRDEAYRIWDAAGRPEGQEQRHWLEAELKLSGSGAVDGPAVKRPASEGAAKTRAGAKALRAEKKDAAEAPAAVAPNGGAVDVAASKSASKTGAVGSKTGPVKAKPQIEAKPSAGAASAPRAPAKTSRRPGPGDSETSKT